MGNIKSAFVFTTLNKRLITAVFGTETKYTITDNVTKTIEYSIPLEKDDRVSYSFFQVNKSTFNKHILDTNVMVPDISLNYDQYSNDESNFKKLLNNYVKGKSGNIFYSSITYDKAESSDYKLRFTNLPIDKISAYILIYNVLNPNTPQVDNFDIVYIEANDMPGVIVSSTSPLIRTTDYSDFNKKKGVINTSINNTPNNKTLINNTMINNTPINKKAPIGKNTFRNLIFN